ncbi:hypothetical protein WNY61_10510 [Sulfitobacter sp. AS92]|uniref:hypothetical protein n=1 Tax=Sulfitobacter sp. AS92 TaxID=3135783 RepID=UPI0031715603
MRSIDRFVICPVSAPILRSAWSVVRESGHILSEGAPRGFDVRAIADHLVADVGGVARAHHLRA